MSDVQLFAFESDFVASLRCVPMAVRLKLDVCGIKLSLRQWSRFTREDRHDLLMSRCSTPTEIAAYHATLVELIARRANEVAKALAEPLCRPWESPHGPADVVIDYARSLGCPPPHRRQWETLTPLQRFALIKLTRDNHDNVNFIPAMKEFGLVAEAGSRRAEEVERHTTSAAQGRSARSATGA